MATATQERHYDLGRVQPVTQAGADYLGNMFGIKSIGGYRAHGSVPNSDHPKGLAADLMTNSKSVGDRLAAFAVAHYKQLGIKYVIWWKRIWTPEKGWHAYSGPSDHTDHVHVSFVAKGGSGKLPDLGGAAAAIGSAVTGAIPGAGSVADGIKGIGDGIRSLAQSALSVGKLANMITMAFLPNNLVRAASGGFGLLFILIGIFFLSREARGNG